MSENALFVLYIVFICNNLLINVVIICLALCYNKNLHQDDNILNTPVFI